MTSKVSSFFTEIAFKRLVGILDKYFVRFTIDYKWLGTDFGGGDDVEIYVVAAVDAYAGDKELLKVESYPRVYNEMTARDWVELDDKIRQQAEGQQQNHSSTRSWFRNFGRPSWRRRPYL